MTELGIVVSVWLLALVWSKSARKETGEMMADIVSAYRAKWIKGV
jgi:hypothetical protein